ncbi:oligosaccharide flippase family protein [Novosphingobium huizhouense]|uniref:oligosaccharide flippase family protein n=1 Tax=Novosphingobium huizhouense TaxID=2866625 RepID=UPI001CD877EC|nr:oligosaccharide flippase family protein [Novosphingobium huizhouense]
MSEPAETPPAREPAAMSVRGAAVWAMAGQYLSFAVQFVTSVLISRLFLGPGEVGLFSIGMAAALVVAVLQDFGLSRYISGLPALDRDEIARCSSVALLFALVIAAALAGASVPLARLYQMPALGPLLRVIALSYLFVPLSVVPMALMARAMQFRGHFVVNVSGALAQGAVALGLAAGGSSSMALAWATVAAAAVRGLVAQGLRPSLPRRLRLDGIARVLGFGARSSLLYLSGALGTRTPDLIVGKALGAFAVGLFSRAASLSDQFRMLISGAIGSVFYPAFARIRDRGEPLGPAYLRVCAGYSGVVWPGMAGLALAAEPLVRALYGPAWAATAMPLTTIALTEILLVALPLHIDLPILAGKLNPLLARNTVDTAMSIALLAIGCRWGVEGAAASRLVYGAGWYALYFGFMRRIIGFDTRALLAIYLRSAATTLAALAPLILAYVLWAPPSAMPFAGLAACALGGGATWLAALALVRHPVLDEIVGIAAQVPLLARLVPARR